MASNRVANRAPKGAERASATRELTLNEVDRINECSYKARGIVGLIRIASGRALDEAPCDYIAGACWAAEGFISEVERIATGTVS